MRVPPPLPPPSASSLVIPRKRSVAISARASAGRLAAMVRTALTEGDVGPQFFVTSDAWSAEVAVFIDAEDGPPAYDLVQALSLAGFPGPIIIVSSHADDDSVVRGYTSGAHVWATPSLSSAQLRAQVAALCKRMLGDDEPSVDVTLDAKRHVVIVNGHECWMEPRGFAIFSFLWERREHWFTQQEILAAVSDTHHRSDTSLVRLQIHKIRGALGRDFAWILRSLEKRGYQATGRMDSTPARTKMPHRRYGSGVRRRSRSIDDEEVTRK